ncbi:MAG: ferrous iron transport protein A [Chloroflexi bacterium]|nr:ferrous iron transport protein A [Chloroflexota bacterium]
MSANVPMPLSMVPIGVQVRLEEIRAGQRLAHRLAELGLTPGIELGVIQNAGGPILVAVRDSRLALGRGMAHKVMVTRIP